MRKLVIATRGSGLALVQAETVKKLIEQQGAEAELKIVKTHGDKDRTSPLSQIGGKGLFVKEIELELSKGDADIAVHSGKDLPYVLADGMIIAGTTKAADFRDCLITVKGRTFPEEPVIGTGSPRRTAEYKRINDKAQFREIRGNVDTRIRKLMEGQYDGIVLAKAGIDRLGIDTSELDIRIFETDECMPAACQGILGIECREEDKEVVELIQKITDAISMRRFEMERKLFCSMEADCSMAVGVHAEVEGDTVWLSAMFEGRKSSVEGQVADADELIELIKKDLQI